jgi:lipopolysaccharide/colanic/teichoic acid biosynthesis glycosyltransferase
MIEETEFPDKSAAGKAKRLINMHVELFYLFVFVSLCIYLYILIFIHAYAVGTYEFMKLCVYSKDDQAGMP